VQDSKPVGGRAPGCKNVLAFAVIRGILFHRFASSLINRHRNLVAELKSAFTSAMKIARLDFRP
jgi:hypothetical protein